MKTFFIYFALLASVTVSFGDPFRNLGFDEGVVTNLAPVPGTPIGVGSISDVLPGWGLTLNGNPISYTRVDLTEAGDNGPILPNVSLVSQSYLNSLQLPIALSVEGRYGLSLSEEAFKSEHFSLTQTGDIPPGAKYLSFLFEGTPITVSINGNALTSTDPNGTYAQTRIVLDVSSYAGQNATLQFDSLGSPIFHLGGGIILDSIAFQVPEPGTVTLFGLGGCALLVAGLRRRR